jgi:prophage antirepressor-like protein
MKNNIQIFKNNQFGSIRVTEIEGKPYFVGKDIAIILGYANTEQAIRQHVDDEDRILVQLSDIQDPLISTPLPDHMKGSKIGLITESGVYSLIFGSTLPKAKEFKKWVTSEVLPSIRKHGMYATPQTIEKMLEDPDTMITILQTLKEERQRNAELKERNQQLQLESAENKQAAEDWFAFGSETVDYGEAAAKLLKDRGYKKRKWAVIDAGIKRIALSLGGYKYIQSVYAELFFLLKREMGVEWAVRFDMSSVKKEFILQDSVAFDIVASIVLSMESMHRKRKIKKMK